MNRDVRGMKNPKSRIIPEIPFSSGMGMNFSKKIGKMTKFSANGNEIFKNYLIFGQGFFPAIGNETLCKKEFPNFAHLE